MATKTKKRGAVSAGTGDVFVDLGFADAGERKLRVKLAMQLNALIAERRITQAQAAALFGIPQPHVSELKNYKLSRFSSERLLRFLTLLDRDVDIDGAGRLTLGLARAKKVLLASVLGAPMRNRAHHS